jgi:ribosome-associated protein
MIQITDHISIDESELRESFIRSSGPGGQNVNKVSTAVQLRFDARKSPSLSPTVKDRLARLAGSRMNLRGEIVIHAQRFRTLERNRQDAVDRLLELIRRAAVEPKPRRATKPTRASVKRRLEAKNQRSATKLLRRQKNDDD